MIKKANISGDTQSLNIKGTGYEFEPLVVVLEKGIKTNLSLDLDSYDNPDSTFTLYDGETGDVVTTFTGKKGIIDVDFNIDKSGSYVVVNNNIAAIGIEVTDSLENVNLEDVRKNFLDN